MPGFVARAESPGAQHLRRPLGLADRAAGRSSAGPDDRRGIVAGTLAAAAALILFGVLIRSVLLTVRRRRAHRMLLDLLTADRPRRGAGVPVVTLSAERDAEMGDLLDDVRILDHSTAVAYTLPGWHSRVVLSAGMLDLLCRAELVAVIDHEKAHVRSRHDLLVLPFQAWATALGWLPGVTGGGRLGGRADRDAGRRLGRSAVRTGHPGQGAGHCRARRCTGRLRSGRFADAGRGRSVGRRQSEPSAASASAAALAVDLRLRGGALLLVLPAVVLLIGWS